MTRLIPLNTAVVSYALGTVGLFSHVLLTVYLGYAAKQISTRSTGAQPGRRLE